MTTSIEPTHERYPTSPISPTHPGIGWVRVTCPAEDEDEEQAADGRDDGEIDEGLLLHEPSSWLLDCAVDPWEGSPLDLIGGSWRAVLPVEDWTPDRRRWCTRCGRCAPAGTRLCSFSFRGRYKPTSEVNAYRMTVSLCDSCRIAEHSADLTSRIVLTPDGFEVDLDV